ncbi:hypothetical protein ABT147_18600 [Streptomyces sp. NPDC001868]|uniref:hypothetical protein n=1 Tax=Streptomyces sp. NPDC001868 TaxID=3154401 RepID=UPI00331C6D4E
MTNREFSEIVQGPMTPDGPSVEEIRAMRHGPGSFVRPDLRAPMGSAVIEGVVVAGDGTMTEEQADQIRKDAGIGRENAHAGQAAKSYTEHRDRVTGQAIRTYGDGRTEVVDESRPADRVRGRG